MPIKFAIRLMVNGTSLLFAFVEAVRGSPGRCLSLKSVCHFEIC